MVFAADTGYYPHLCVALVSLLKNNRDLNIHAYVLTNKLSDQAEAPLRALEKQYDNFVLEFQAVDDSLFAGLDLTIEYISVQTYYRYILARLFPELDKILYLDSDLVVCGSLKELWAENLDGYCAAAVRDPYVAVHCHSLLESLGFQGRNDYVNTGVMLFNLKEIREHGFVDEFFSCHRTHQQILRFQDQDVLNMVLRDRIKLLPEEYNLTAAKVSRKNLPSVSQRPPVIVHFTGKGKPWSSHWCRHSCRREYYKYILDTPFAKKAVYYRIIQWYGRIRDFVFYAQSNPTAFRIKILGIQVYKKIHKK